MKNRRGSADKESNDWDKEDKVSLMELKRRLEACKVEEAVALNRRQKSATRQEGDLCKKIFLRDGERRNTPGREKT